MKRVHRALGACNITVIDDEANSVPIVNHLDDNVDIFFVGHTYPLVQEVVYHDVYKFYNNYNDGTKNIFSIPPKLSFPLSTLASDCWLCVPYAWTQNLTADQSTAYCKDVVDRESIVRTSGTISFVDMFPSHRTFHTYYATAKWVTASEHCSGGRLDESIHFVVQRCAK